MGDALVHRGRAAESGAQATKLLRSSRERRPKFSDDASCAARRRRRGADARGAMAESQEELAAQLAAERERIRTLRPSVDKWRTKLGQLEMTKATLLENMKKLYDEAARRVAERDATLRELRGRER